MTDPTVVPGDSRDPREPLERRDLRKVWADAIAAAAPFELHDGPTVIVVPHPDDETLSTGALIIAQRRAGRRVIVVAVTDGDAAYDPAGDPRLGAERRSEQERALATLGVEPTDIVRLAVPDGRVSDCTEAVETALCRILTPRTLVVAPWTHDVHPDHEACGRAAAAAARTVGADIVFGLFWTYHHRAADDLEGVALLRLDVDSAARDVRARALACHRSQFDHVDDPPILDEHITEPAGWDVEMYVEGIAS